MIKKIGIGVALLATVVLFIDVSSENFAQRVKREIREIKRAGAEHPSEQAPAALEQLPVPVQRYFRYALKESASKITVAFVAQSGEFRTKETNAWIPFDAEQYFAAGRPAFIWHAKLKSSPYFWIDARDMYHEGRGLATGRLFSAIPVSSAVGQEADISSLARYLTEIPWVPTALLPSKHLDWKPIDSDSAMAIIRDKGRTVSAIFTFNSAGEIVTITTEDKFRKIRSKMEKSNWTAYYSNYTEYSGLMVPTRVEAEWSSGDRKYTYIRLRLTNVSYASL